MSALADSIDWDDSMDVKDKPKKKTKKGTLKQEMRDSRRCGDMSDLQHITEVVHRHRQTLWTMVLTAVFVNVVWMVLTNRIHKG